MEESLSSSEDDARLCDSQSGRRSPKCWPVSYVEGHNTKAHVGCGMMMKAPDSNNVDMAARMDALASACGVLLSSLSDIIFSIARNGLAWALNVPSCGGSKYN